MCAEFTYGPPTDLDALLQALQVFNDIQDWVVEHSQKRVFPKNLAPVIIKNEQGQYQLIKSEFSLIPEWWDPSKSTRKSKSNRPPFATHNARLETIAEKPAFRNSFKKFHCLIPIYSFFESSVFGDQFAGHRIRVKASEILFAAGCYSEWIDKTSGEILHSFTIITHTPPEQIFKAGHDRLPVFLNSENAMLWLHRFSDSQKSREFLIKNNQGPKIDFEISIDRPLKDGWQKNSPSSEELSELQKTIKVTG